jgi:uncharacterized membrane protein
VIGARPHQRTDARTAQRNGHRPRLLATPAGDVELKIPKLRSGSFFPSLLERRRRIDRALFAVVMEAYVHGISTRKVDDLVQALGVSSGISKSEVSRICGELDRDLDASLDDVAGVTDVALVYKTGKGKVKIRQTSDAIQGRDLMRGGLLGGVASIFVGPLVGMAAAGAAAGALYGAVRDTGVSDELMKLAGDQLDAGRAAVFVLTDDATAHRIGDEVAKVADGEAIEVGDFPVDAQALVCEALKVGA